MIFTSIKINEIIHFSMIFPDIEMHLPDLTDKHCSVWIQVSIRTDSPADTVICATGCAESFGASRNLTPHLKKQLWLKQDSTGSQITASESAGKSQKVRNAWSETIPVISLRSKEEKKWPSSSTKLLWKTLQATHCNKKKGHYEEAFWGSWK